MSSSSPLVCGPLVRYVDRTSAVIWVELDQGLEIEVQLSPTTRYGHGLAQSARAWPVRINSSYYAWISCRWLLPDTWYSYRIVGHRPGGSYIELWPDSRLSGTPLPSVFRTLPSWSLDTVRMVFGSCRAGFQPEDPRASEEGIDALHALAIRLSDDWDDRETTWPHLMLFTGDQIYADNLSQRLRDKFRRPPLHNPFFTSNHATTYPQFAEVYREAWTGTPYVRWLLSCIPSFMIADDHEVIDDWNITAEWVEERRSPRWIRRLAAALMAYWIYQGAGNLAPRQWRTDERMRPLTPRLAPIIGDVTHTLERLFEGYVKGSRRVSWSYAINVAGTQVVVADTRMSRKLKGRRLLMDDKAWSEYVYLAKDRRNPRTLLVTPGPVLFPHALHDLASWVAEKLFESGTLSFGDVVRGVVVGGLTGLGPLMGTLAFRELVELLLSGKVQGLELEMWPVFPTSFERMLTLLEQLVDGVGTTRKRFVALISGDVHYSYIMRGELVETARRASILQFTMSPFRRLWEKQDREELKKAIAGDLPFYVDLLKERPNFVDEQMHRAHWYPLKVDGTPADESDVDEWTFFGEEENLNTFLGWIEFQGSRVTYRYERAVRGGTAGIHLEEIGQSSLIAF